MESNNKFTRSKKIIDKSNLILMKIIDLDDDSVKTGKLNKDVFTDRNKLSQDFKLNHEEIRGTFRMN